MVPLYQKFKRYLPFTPNELRNTESCPERRRRGGHGRGLGQAPFGDLEFWRARQNSKSPNGACPRPRPCPPRRRRSGQLSVFLSSFGVNGKYLLNFWYKGTITKLTLAALKFGVGNVKNRRFQLGLVRFLPGFYRNTHRELVNTTTKGFGLEPRRSIQVVCGLKSVSRQFQLVT